MVGTTGILLYIYINMYLFIQTLHVCIYVCKINIATENLLLKELKLVKSYTSPRHGFSAFCRHNSQCHSMLMSVASNGARCVGNHRGKVGHGFGLANFLKKKILGHFYQPDAVRDMAMEKEHFFEGDTSLNCCFSILMLIFGGVCITT